MTFPIINENKHFEILIVDDIPENLQLMSNLLYQNNIDISIATDGAGALEAIKNKDFDLILLDIALPDMLGYDICKEIKADKRTKEIPVIFITARHDIDSITKGFEVGGQDYVTKPFRAEELIARVRNQLELKISRDELKKMNTNLEKIVFERTAQLEYTNVQLENANESLIAANMKLSKFDKAKNDFLLLVNHELRTPLHGLKGLSSILSDALETTEYSDIVSSINVSADRLIKLSEAALLITTLKVENYKTHTDEFLITDMINKIEGDLDIENENINIKVLKPEGEIKIATDHELLCRCLMNILENAISHSKENDIVFVEVIPRNKEITINILDNGPGFSEEVLKNNFDIFFSKNEFNITEGFGLGLATSKLIIDNLNGNIEIGNRREGGAIVKINLPVA